MQITLITDIPNYRATNFPTSVFVEWTGNEHAEVTATEFAHRISQYIALFSQLGIGSGSRVATYCQSTRINLIAAEFAVIYLRGIVCPMHASSTAKTLADTLKNITPSFCIVRDNKDLVTIENASHESSSIKLIQLDLLEFNAPVSKLTFMPKADDSALIISTSGTSGDPKGVLLSHHNVITTALSGAAVVPIHSKHTLLSFLPISHILERTVLYSAMLLGAQIHFSDSPRHAYLLLNRVKPHYFTGVPRNLERTFVRFQHASRQRGFFSRQIFEWSLRQDNADAGIGSVIARMFVLRKLKKLFGARIKGIVVGGAAMNAEIIRWFEMAGIKVREGYGLSETSGVVTINRFTPGEFKFGTTGRPLPGIEVKIKPIEGEENGEILVRGPSLTRGYLIDGKFEKITTENGWFSTGDSGQLDDDGFLIITGRIKDNFKNSFGQYVSPVRIEQRLELDIGVNRSIVIGFQRPFTSAIISPDFEFLESWAQEHNVHWTDAAYMIHNPDIIRYFQTKIDAINKKTEVHEHILGFALVAEEWTEENGSLTPTLKLRRQVLIDKYAKVIGGIYK